MSTSAGDPTYINPNSGWTVQLNAGSGTGPSHMGVVAGELNYTSSTVNGVQQPVQATGPLSSTAADRSGSGAISVDLEKRVNRGNVPPSHPADAAEGVY